MSVLLVAALLAALSSIITIGCVAYVVISFRRGGHLMASRVSRRPLALILVEAGASPRQSARPARHRPRLQPVFAS
jgi:choline dehydrogenase-like flavoprotein